MNEKDQLLLVKYKVRQETNNAINSGYIEKLPCRICRDVKVQAHHPDYTRPLDVVWLCKYHHDALHYYERRPFMADGSIDGLQKKILDYLLLDHRCIFMPNLVEDCGAETIQNAALAIANLLVKGYLIPVAGRTSENYEEEILTELEEKEKQWKSGG